MEVDRDLGSSLARWRSSGANFGSHKFLLLIQNAKRAQQRKFLLPNMFISREMKSRKLSIICMGDILKISIHFLKEFTKISHTNNREFSGFYF